MNDYNDELDALSSVNEQETIPNDTPKASKSFKGILFLLILLISLAVGYFYGYPWYLSKFVYSPDKIYGNLIDKLKNNVISYYDKIDSFVKYEPFNKASSVTNLSIMTDYDKLSKLNGETYTLNLSIDKDIKAIDAGILIKNDTNTFNLDYFIRDNNQYYTIDGTSLIKDNLLSSTSSIFSYYDGINDASEVDTKYLINKIFDVVSKSLNTSRIVKVEEKITFNVEKANVNNFKYVLNKAEKERIIKYIVDELKNDDNFKDYDLDKLLNLNVGSSEDYFNLYMMNNKFVGISFTRGENELFHFYCVNKFSELEFNHSGYGDITNYFYGNDNSYEVQVKKTVNNRFLFKEGDNLVITYYADDSEMFNITVKEFSNKKLSFNFANVNIINIPLNLDVELSRTRKSLIDTITLFCKVNLKTNYININFDSTIDRSKSVNNITTSKAVTLTDEQASEYYVRLISSFMNTGLGSLLN